MLAGENAVGCFDLVSSVGLVFLSMRLWPHILERANRSSGQGAKPVGRDAIRELHAESWSVSWVAWLPKGCDSGLLTASQSHSGERQRKVSETMFACGEP